MSRRRAALPTALAAVPLAAAAGWLTYSALGIPHDAPLPPALPGEVLRLDTPAGRVALYADGPVPFDTEGAEEWVVRAGVPLLLVHSVNAAASAYEVRPLYLGFRATRPVYALDLPGFGLSERRDRVYTPPLMADAIAAAVAAIRSRHGGGPIDALGLSLSCEYLARAALERPDGFRSLGLVSPTGFDAKLAGDGRAQADRGNAFGRTAVSVPLWSRALFDLLVSRPSMRYFIERTWGGPAIDEGLLDYGYRSAHRPGAEHAAWSFLAGYLFPDDVSRIYRLLRLPVWMARGSRGGFVDYRHVGEVAGRPNWTFAVYDTGAFPQFEVPERVTRAYGDFVAALDLGHSQRWPSP